MDLLKEAVFTEEEQKFIINLFTAHFENAVDLRKHITKAAELRMKEDRIFKFAEELADSVGEVKMMDEIKSKLLSERLKDFDSKVNLARSIVVKMHLYKNCVINAE